MATKKKLCERWPLVPLGGGQYHSFTCLKGTMIHSYEIYMREWIGNLLQQYMQQIL